MDTPISAAAAKPVTTGTQSIEGVSVSGDGEWIAFDSNRSGNQDIYRVRRAGGKPEAITNHPSDDFLPSWSPDSKSIAFYSFRNGNRDIFVMSADGKEVQQITNDPAEERYPDWSPDGQSIVFFSDKTGGFELYVISKIDGNWGRSRPLTNQPSVWLHWSPDGRFIAYNLSLPPPYGGVAIISPDGSGRRLMAPSQPSFLPQYPIWSRNSRTLYFKVNDAENHASLWSVPLAGGAAKPLVKFEDPLRTFYRSEFAASEKEFFFTMTEREADIWVLQMQP